jgi:GntR family transcriptional regulator, transcriptional repressor for pyruvate dehydrogenase complex
MSRASARSRPATDRPRRSRSLAEEVVDALTRRIRAGRPRAGEKLPSEAEIMAEHGVSRTVVREALSRLQAAGLVQTHHGIGTFVRDAPESANFRIDPQELDTLADVLALLELRMSVEAEAAALAAQRRTAAQLAAIRRALAEFAASLGPGGDAVGPDFQFHLEIARATGNRHFTELMNYLGTMIIPRTRVNSARLAHEDRSAYLERVHREHESICEAIARRDPDAARAAMRTHLANSRERLRRAQEAALAEP